MWGHKIMGGYPFVSLSATRIKKRRGLRRAARREKET
jgi:hypothetical protein